jgi:hypothetical protein
LIEDFAEGLTERFPVLEMEREREREGEVEEELGRGAMGWVEVEEELEIRSIGRRAPSTRCLRIKASIILMIVSGSSPGKDSKARKGDNKLWLNKGISVAGLP